MSELAGCRMASPNVPGETGSAGGSACPDEPGVPRDGCPEGAPMNKMAEPVESAAAAPEPPDEGIVPPDPPHSRPRPP